MSEQYRSTVSNKKLPEFCRKWACWGHVLRSSANYSQAGWAYLNSAWACDDARKSELAVGYRGDSLTCFRLAQDNKETFGKNRAIENSIIADLLRRTRQFKEASVVAVAVLESLIDMDAEDKPLIESVGRFQMHLVEIDDSRTYTYAEAERYGAEPDRWHPPKWWEIWR